MHPAMATQAPAGLTSNGMPIPEGGLFTVAVNVPRDFSIVDVATRLRAVGEVRSVDTLLVDLFGVAVVTFFCAQEMQPLRAACAAQGMELLPMPKVDSDRIVCSTASVVMGPASEWKHPSVDQIANAFGPCLKTRISGSDVVVDFFDSRHAMRCQWWKDSGGISTDTPNDKSVAEVATDTSIQGGSSCHGASSSHPSWESPDTDGSGQTWSEPRKPGNDPNLEINLEAVEAGLEVRTTCVISNIPQELDTEVVHALVDEAVGGRYTCFVVPLLPYKRDRASFAFIHLSAPADVLALCRALHGRPHYDDPDNVQFLEVRFAKVQGTRKIMRTWGRLDARKHPPLSRDLQARGEQKRTAPASGSSSTSSSWTSQ
mmetsp:Transcript_41930/g.100778  ORF Transcript_41930/g.100778 Transcript_41930/m.100778 type:complete len:372 (+) Transcript_41930:44-1159(+)